MRACMLRLRLASFGALSYDRSVTLTAVGAVCCPPCEHDIGNGKIPCVSNDYCVLICIAEVTSTSTKALRRPEYTAVLNEYVEFVVSPARHRVNKQVH